MIENAPYPRNILHGLYFTIRTDYYIKKTANENEAVVVIFNLVAWVFWKERKQFRLFQILQAYFP